MLSFVKDLHITIFTNAKFFPSNIDSEKKMAVSLDRLCACAMLTAFFTDSG